MSADAPDAAALVAACAAEVAAVAGDAGGATRRRLLVVAHALALAGRDLAAGAAPAGDPALAAAIRAGRHDAELAQVATRLRDGVRARVEIAHPGYAAR
ncbi:MAG TPA: DUF6285 domain-containing protein [Baekduia sp.]|nr:DUF6285 domain-containing protein [Baekduia sp.]